MYNLSNRMEKTRITNWNKEEYTLINDIKVAGGNLRGSGNNADINKKKKQLRKTLTAKVNAFYGNNRGVEDVEQLRRSLRNRKWTLAASEK